MTIPRRSLLRANCPISALLCCWLSSIASISAWWFASICTRRICCCCWWCCRVVCVSLVIAWRNWLPWSLRWVWMFWYASLTCSLTWLICCDMSNNVCLAFSKVWQVWLSQFWCCCRLLSLKLWLLFWYCSSSSQIFVIPLIMSFSTFFKLNWKSCCCCSKLVFSKSIWDWICCLVWACALCNVANNGLGDVSLINDTFKFYIFFSGVRVFDTNAIFALARDFKTKVFKQFCNVILTG